MEKLNTHSPDFTARNVAKLAELFPNCVTESKDDKGNLRNSIDFDLLKQELSADIVEGPKERYRLDWPGKREALITANTPITKTLRPHRQESVDFDTTKNLFIEGDNLDALKLLKETYLGKVKMIYIDPPYNTGNDFIYKDKFAESAEEYHLESGQKDEEGNRLVANTDSNGRFHSDWLSMMYPRLKLARNLLKDDGVIFISIDDNEVSNIRKMCDEVFGEENFVGEFIWKKKQGGGNDSNVLIVEHEYIVSYSKDILGFRFGLDKDYELDSGFYPNHDEKGVYGLVTLDKSSIRFSDSLVFEIRDPGGNVYSPRVIKGKQSCWRWSKKKVNENYNQLVFKDGKVYTKYYRPSGIVPKSLLIDAQYGRTASGNYDVQSLFENGNPFSYPKPLSLLRHFIMISSEEDDIVLDFFAGSATTAHAVMQLNAEDGGNRRFIMIQLPEKSDEKSEAFNVGYENIADISKERIRRAGRKIKRENTEESQLDIGFRVLKIDTSNIVDVENTPDTIEQGQLQNLIENIKQDRGSEDLLFQVLLNWGVDLTLPITTETVKGLEVFFVDKDALAACFATGGQITEDLCKELATRKPLRVVFRDSGFENDSVKVNVEQIFKLLSPSTDVKTI